MAKLESYVAKLMESVAVLKVTIGGKQAELMNLLQDRNEPFITLAMFVRGKVKTCNFTTVSDCGKRNVTSYMEEAMKGGNTWRWGVITSREKSLALNISCLGHLIGYNFLY